MPPRTSLYLRAVALAVPAIALAVEAVRLSVGNVYARSAPELALRFAPDNARALSSKLDAELLQQKKGTTLTSHREQLRAVLRGTPLNASSLRLLGMEAEGRAKLAEARRLVRLSDRVSRRDSIAQMWLIEDAVQRSDIAEALNHYDVALTTSMDLRPMLFAVLTGALQEPEIRAGMARYMAARRPWRVAFLKHAAAQAAPRDVAALLSKAGVADDSDLREINALVINRFIGERQVSGAIDFASKLPGAQPEHFAAFGFTAATTDPAFAPLTWRVNDGAVSASLDGDGRVTVIAEPGAGGTAIDRVVRVRPGRYRMRHKVTISDTPPARLWWDWQCLGTRLVSLGEFEIPLTAGLSDFQAAVTVPADCDGVAMILKAAGPEGSGAASAILESFAIAPVSADDR